MYEVATVVHMKLRIALTSLYECCFQIGSLACLMMDSFPVGGELTEDATIPVSEIMSLLESLII